MVNGIITFVICRIFKVFQCMIRSIIMVVALAFIGNTVNLVALAMNKERYETPSK